MYLAEPRRRCHPMSLQPSRLFSCQGCRGPATHFFRMAVWRGSRKRGSNKGMGEGYRACLDCIALWQRYGRVGVITEIRADGRPLRRVA